MYRELLHQNRSRELVTDFLDQFLARHGWWAARAAWVSEAGMVVDPWRVDARAPQGLDVLRRQQLPARPIDPGPQRFPEPVQLAVDEVRCTAGVAEALDGEGVDGLTVVDIAGMLDFDVRLVFAGPEGHADDPSVIEALRSSAALLPTLLRQEVERNELRLSGLHDPLTGLLNRAGLDELASQLAVGPETRAVIYIDLDGFKEVNDSHGHAAGDVVLEDTAGLLSRLVRPTDLVARIGGDEFVVVATSVLDLDAAVSLAQRLVAALSRDTIVASGSVASVAASAGVAVWAAGVAFRDAVEAADALMYEAKRIGGGIAVQDASGRVLVRDPYGGEAAPEEVDRDRSPVRVLTVHDIVDAGEWGVHILLRGELCSMPSEQAVTVINEAVAFASHGQAIRHIIIEPRGRGWSREGLLPELVELVQAQHPDSTLLVMVDSQPASNELRHVVDEVRARCGVGVVLAGVGTASGGDLRMMAQLSPAIVALDREATLNLEHTERLGALASIAGAAAAGAGAVLLVLEPPSSLTIERLASWGVRLVAEQNPITPPE